MLACTDNIKILHCEEAKLAKAEEVPRELLEELYTLQFADGGCADRLFLAQGSQEQLVESRKTDISDTFVKFRDTVGTLLGRLGVSETGIVDFVTMYVAVQERCGFESGVKFVHDNAHVTSKEEARRQASVLSSMKTAGVS